MQYEIPQVEELGAAITSVQGLKAGQDGDSLQDASPVYQDWE